MNQNLFIETFMSDLPSPSSNRYSNSSLTKNQAQHRIATKNHCVEINGAGIIANSNALRIIVDRLPRVDDDNDKSDNNDNIEASSDTADVTTGRGENKVKADQEKIMEHHHLTNNNDGTNTCTTIPLSSSSSVTGGGATMEGTKPTASTTGSSTPINLKERKKPKEKDDYRKRLCIAHSFLPLFDPDITTNTKKQSMTFFIEAFVLKANKIDGSEKQQVTTNGTIVTEDSASIIHHDNTSSSKGNNNSNYVSTNASSDNTNLYYLVLRGYLPPNADTCCNGSSASVYSKNNKKQKSRNHKKEKRKSSYKHQCNFMSTIPLSYKPSLVKLCKIGTDTYDSDNDINSNDRDGNDDGDNDDHRREEIPQVGLYIVTDTTLKFYQITKDTKRNTSSDHKQKKKLIMEERKLIMSSTIDKLSLSLSDSNDQHENGLISLLLQNSSTNQQIPSYYSDPFHFNSPIMVIDTVQVTNEGEQGGIVNYVAFGCQNGIIRIISYSTKLSNSNENFTTKDNSFSIFRVTEFLVDGHVLVANFNISTKSNHVDLIIGSSCGFACVFTKSLGLENTFHQRPHMIVEGLWNAKKKEDDSVLSVCKIPYLGMGNGSSIVIGTMSGRALLFTRHGNHERDTMSEFSCIWHVQLHHPIHTITYKTDENGLLSLIILTQKTVHLFNMSIESCVRNAKTRLISISNDYKRMCI